MGIKDIDTHWFVVVVAVLKQLRRLGLYMPSTRFGCIVAVLILKKWNRMHPLGDIIVI